MLINYVPSPHGSPQVGSQVIRESDHLEGYVEIQNVVLLFEFDNLLMNGVTVVVSVIDPPTGSELDRGELRWENGDQSIKCVEFSDFPPDESGAPMERGFYNVQMFVTSLATEATPREMIMTIYKG